jgi:hypothetical protein
MTCTVLYMGRLEMITFCIVGCIFLCHGMSCPVGRFIMVPVNIWEVLLQDIILPLCSALERFAAAYVVQHIYALIVAKLISVFLSLIL